MSTIRGGDIRQFTLGGRELDPAAEADFEITVSGQQNEFKPTGNGQMVGTGKRVLGAIDSIEVSIDNGRGDFEYIAGIQEDGEPVPVTLTLVDGTVYSGSMGVEGELKQKSGSGTASFALRGPKLEQI